VRRDHESGKTPLAGLPQAPDHFFEMWDRGVRELHDGLITESTSDPDDSIPPAYVIKHIVGDGGGADLSR
jgi:hypothetical protein